MNHQTEFYNLLESPEVKNALFSKDNLLFEQILSSINNNTKTLMQVAYSRGVQVGEQSAKKAMFEYLDSIDSTKQEPVELVPNETYADIF